MDPLTHTLAGAAMGRAGLQDRYGKGTTLELALLSSLPDVDQLLMFTGDPLYILDRRGLCHSVVGIPILCLAAAGLFSLVKKDIRYRDHVVLGLIACSLHVFMDLINSFGVVVLYPFLRTRFELAGVFIIDVALTGLLAIAVILGSVGTRRRARLAARAGLSLVAMYLGLCFGLRGAAAELLEKNAPGGPGPRTSYVFPEPFGPLRWRGVVRTGSEFHVFLLEPFKKRAKPELTLITEEADPRVILAREHPTAKRLEWFFKMPVWRVDRREGKGGAVSVSDLRFRTILLDRGVPFGYGFELDADGKIVKEGWL